MRCTPSGDWCADFKWCGRPSPPGDRGRSVERRHPCAPLMNAMATDDPSPVRTGFRFSLRDLLLVFAAVCITFGVCRWNLVVGVAAGVALLGILTVSAGIRSRRRGAILVGTLFVIGALVFVADRSLTVTTWVGSHELDVYVSVVDASTLAPICSAKVEPLNGPYSRLEGLPPVVDRAFEIIPLANGIALTTDDRGHTEFSHRFFASGSDGLFTKTGYVDTRRVWLRVTCPGHVETYLPIDRQSTHPRDIRNDRPIWVTVSVAKH